MDNFMMPPPPMQPQQGGYRQTAYDAYGNPIQVEMYPPQQYQQQYQQPQMMQQPVYQQPPQPQYQQPVPQQGLGVSFAGLIGGNVPIRASSELDNIVTDVAPKRKRKPVAKKDENGTNLPNPMQDGEEVLNPLQEKLQQVESMDYDETYNFTNAHLRTIINQSDIVATNLKMELDKLQNSNIKGKYTYIANLASAMNGFLSTKATAIREINSSVKAVNDAEYRRYKDNRAANNEDDAKYIMDMYNAYIQTPVGSMPGVQQYYQPTSLDITTGMNGIIRADAASPEARDAGFNSFMNSLTPEQNMMITAEGNPNIQEVVVYDHATGQKYFDWKDMTTGQSIPNLPRTDKSMLEDFVIDPIRRVAKNSNMRTSMPVVYINEGILNEY